MKAAKRAKTCFQMSFKNLPPLNVDVWRGANIESRHSVSAVVVNSSGQIQHAWGETSQKIYPRSSIKALQALPIILSGAVDRFAISEIELALASASHNGEPEQVEVIQRWLQRLGLSVNDLECGAHLPGYPKAAAHLIQSGNQFTALHNNCSGKHTGMLATALALQKGTQGYSKASHPVQTMIKKLIEDFCSEQIPETDIAIDGCSIPTYYLPMKSLATGMARLGDPENLIATYRQAAAKVYASIVANPYFVAGTDRYCTLIMTALNGRALVKTGAEGVMFATIPELKLGVVVKVHDGAVRAAEIAMSFILNELGLLDQQSAGKFCEIPVRNWNQILTGRIIINSEL